MPLRAPIGAPCGARGPRRATPPGVEKGPPSESAAHCAGSDQTQIPRRLPLVLVMATQFLRSCLLAAIFVYATICQEMQNYGSMCGEVPCELYASSENHGQAAPPDDGWELQNQGFVPPGSLNMYSKREMFGGTMYGAFGMDGTDQRLHNDETVAFNYRDYPSEVGRIYAFPSGAGPPPTGHFLMLNFEGAPTSILNPSSTPTKEFRRDESMFSSSGLFIPERPLDDIAHAAESTPSTASDGALPMAGINPVTGIDLSERDDSVPGFVGTGRAPAPPHRRC